MTKRMSLFTKRKRDVMTANFITRYLCIVFGVVHGCSYIKVLYIVFCYAYQCTVGEQYADTWQQKGAPLQALVPSHCWRATCMDRHKLQDGHPWTFSCKSLLEQWTRVWWRYHQIMYEFGSLHGYCGKFVFCTSWNRKRMVKTRVVGWRTQSSLSSCVRYHTTFHCGRIYDQSAFEILFLDSIHA